MCRVQRMRETGVYQMPITLAWRNSMFGMIWRRIERLTSKRITKKMSSLFFIPRENGIAKASLPKIWMQEMWLLNVRVLLWNPRRARNLACGREAFLTCLWICKQSDYQEDLEPMLATDHRHLDPLHRASSFRHVSLLEFLVLTNGSLLQQLARGNCLFQPVTRPINSWHSTRIDTELSVSKLSVTWTCMDGSYNYWNRHCASDLCTLFNYRVNSTSDTCSNLLPCLPD